MYRLILLSEVFVLLIVIGILKHYGLGEPL